MQPVRPSTLPLPPPPHPTELFSSLTPSCTPQLRYENSRLMFLLALEIFNHLIFIWNIIPFFVHCTEKITFTQSCKWNSKCEVIVVSQVERGIFFIPNVALSLPPSIQISESSLPIPSVWQKWFHRRTSETSVMAGRKAFQIPRRPGGF